MHPRARAGRRRRVVALAATALAGAALAPAAAHAQFPVYSKDKWLGSISEFTRPLFTQYFNQITPENGGKWGVAAGTTRTAAMRWNAARPGLQLRRRPTASRSTSTSCCGATSSRRGWRRCRPRSSWPRSRSGSRPSPRATRTSTWLQVVNEPTWDPPDGSVPEERRHELRLQRQLRAGARRRQRHRRHGLRLDPQRLPAGQAVLPQHQADAQRRRHHGHDRSDGRVPEDHQHPQAREPDRRDRAPGARLRVHPQQPERPLRSRATRTCPSTTWRCTRPTSTASPRPACRSRSPSSTSTASRSTASRATRCSSRYYRQRRPHLLGAPLGRGHHALGLAAAQPLAQRPERADRALQRHAQARRRCGSTTTSAASPR